ncbi:hypothetical protein ZHAS_00009984 [Anopheles sinensis]|uniref:Uncharacterized protein n=1 Tax=Anopheles sinensis TaxID=74873 RepID=A0A084VWF6_ANOSI|nr:hypothetical protein ZHAS_00009984 [Anopheles sinensis]
MEFSGYMSGEKLKRPKPKSTPSCSDFSTKKLPSTPSPASATLSGKQHKVHILPIAFQDIRIYSRIAIG